MQKKLQWNAIGIKKHVDSIFDLILDKRQNLPRQNTVSYRRLTGFLDQLTQIKMNLSSIDENIIPNLQSRFRIEFKTPELIYIAFSRPSIRNIFENVEKEFIHDDNVNVSRIPLKELQSTGEAGNVLALVGDSVLGLSVIQVLWDSSLANVGDLTQKKDNIVSNENLSRFADELNLYSYRLCKYGDPSEQDITEKKLNHEKGTLVEAIIGVIYLEFGLEQVERIIPIIQ